MRMRFRSFVVSAVALTMALCVIPRAAAPSNSKPRPAPTFTLPTANGTVVLDSLRGRVVLVDFWASWCVPCRGSFAWMKSMHERYSSKGLSIVAINLDKERPAADAFLADVKVPFTVAFDPRGRTAESFRVQAMPTSFIVSPSGAIVYTHLGFDPKKTAEFEHMIQEACER
jgi:thiol-disulfide isomerase/thioredoxin